MKVTYQDLRGIALNTEKTFEGSPLELHSARVTAYTLTHEHPEEHRRYATRTDYKKRVIHITALKANL